MAYINKPRPYKKEYVQQKKRGRSEQERRNARERARYAMDKTGVDKNKNGKADKREGKDIDHKKPLSKGGNNKKKNLMVVKASTKRSFKRNSDRSVKKNA